MAKEERSPIDAKRMRGATAIGVILIFVGILIFFYGIYCIVMWGLGDRVAGVIGIVLIMLLGTAIMAAGGALAFIGTFRKIFGRRNRRSLY
jgi:hypothetical protein